YGGNKSKYTLQKCKERISCLVDIGFESTCNVRKQFPQLVNFYYDCPEAIQREPLSPERIKQLRLFDAEVLQNEQQEQLNQKRSSSNQKNELKKDLKKSFNVQKSELKSKNVVLGKTISTTGLNARGNANANLENNSNTHSNTANLNLPSTIDKVTTTIS